MGDPFAAILAEPKAKANPRKKLAADPEGELDDEMGEGVAVEETEAPVAEADNSDEEYGGFVKGLFGGDKAKPDVSVSKTSVSVDPEATEDPMIADLLRKIEAGYDDTTESSMIDLKKLQPLLTFAAGRKALMRSSDKLPAHMSKFLSSLAGKDAESDSPDAV